MGSAKTHANFYCKEGVGDVPGEEETGGGCYYIHIDEFGKVQFYDDSNVQCYLKDAVKPVELGDVYFNDSIEVYPYGESDYQNARWDCDFDACYIQDWRLHAMSDVQDEATDISICESAPEFDFPVAGTLSVRQR